MKKLTILVLLLLTVLQFSACLPDNYVDKVSSESVLITESNGSTNEENMTDGKNKDASDEESSPDGNSDDSVKSDEGGKWTGVHKPQ